MPKNLFAILLILISVFFGSTMGALMKLAQTDLNVYTAGFLRFFSCFLLHSLAAGDKFSKKTFSMCAINNNKSLHVTN